MLSDRLQEIARRYLGARRRSGEAPLDAARWLSEARAEAQHGEWQVFLEATSTSDDTAERLLNIHTQAMQNPQFAESIRTNWIGQSVASLLARPSTPPDPARQVTAQATALNDFLKRQGINRFVERAVALAESQPFDQFADAPIAVWLPFNLAQQAQALATKYPPSNDELARINDLLRRRADEQRAVEAAQQKPTRRSTPP